MNAHPFQRTTCACTTCVQCCRDQPGPLAPGDFTRIAQHLNESEDAARAYFWSSPGALVAHRLTGRRYFIGTITPRVERGRCIFLDETNRCRIHAVAPFGCAYFDTHMDARDSRARSTYYLTQIQQDEEYRRLRATLPPATSYRPKAF